MTDKVVAAAIWAAAEKQAQDRRSTLPTEDAARRALYDSYLRLKEMGWSDIRYCPKDGSMFLVIEVGSTGVFRCHYSGEWPKGTWWIEDGGDLWPSRPCLWKPLPEVLTEDDG